MKALPAPNVRVLEKVLNKGQDGESLEEKEGWRPGGTGPGAIIRERKMHLLGVCKSGRRMPDEALSDPRLVHFLRLDEALGSVGEVDNGCHLVALKDITDVKVEVS